jgi:hypothetical protein
MVTQPGADSTQGSSEAFKILTCVTRQHINIDRRVRNLMEPHRDTANDQILDLIFLQHLNQPPNIVSSDPVFRRHGLREQ